MGGLNRIATLFAVTATVCWIMVAISVAHTATLPPDGAGAVQTVPEAGNSGSSNEPLSNKLDRQNGVIHPPAGVDSGMAQTPPAAGKTPVIPPAGTPGGSRGTTPK